MHIGDARTEIEYNNAILTARIVGEIDHHTAKAVRTAIDKAIYLYRPTAVVIDLEMVGFMDSSGLGLILGRVTVAENVGAAVHLRRLPPRVRRILDMAGVSKLPALSIESEKKETAV